jgi:hypothetical protein
MRKFWLVLFLLPLGSMAYCSLPLTSVAVLTITLSDQTGGTIEADAAATYLDADGAAIVSITSEMPSSWDNNLHWWSHSKHATSTLRPADAKRAVAVEITAKGCETARIPVALERHYEALSFAPHGGGAAYFIYEFERDVVLQCG